MKEQLSRFWTSNLHWLRALEQTIPEKAAEFYERSADACEVSLQDREYRFRRSYVFVDQLLWEYNQQEIFFACEVNWSEMDKPHVCDKFNQLLEIAQATLTQFKMISKVNFRL